MGLDVDICSGVDRILDEEPPTVGEIASVVEDIVPSEDDYNERFSRYFGFSYTEFPDMYAYVLRTKGRDAALCLVMHIVLDVLEDLSLRGYEPDAAKGIVFDVVGGYEENCRIMKCEGYEDIFAYIRKLLDANLNYIIDEVRTWVSQRTTQFDVVLKASSEILNPTLRLKLIVEGFHGKRKTTVNMNAFRKALPIARNELRQKLFKMLTEKEIDLGKTLEGINNVRKREKAKMTYHEQFEIINEEAEKNSDFKKLVEIIRESCTIAIDKIKKELST